MDSPQISNSIKEIIEQTKKFETIGRYEEATSLLSVYWTSISEQPDVSNLNTEEQAEILLRCGSLAGNLGSCRQITNAQELAQSILKKARNLFFTLNLREKVAECEARLATTYYRLGNFDEARIWLNSALSEKLDENSETGLYIYVIEGLILEAEKNYVELVKTCEKLEQLFHSSSYLVLQGDFNNNYAIGLMRLGKTEEAVKRFELAKTFYVQTEHYLYLAGLENNLAGFYQIEGRYEEAHQSAKSATENFKKMGDKTREGYSIDTQAQIYMSEGKYKEALACAKKAIKRLSNGENYCYLANSMQTKSHIEFYLKDYANSLKTMIASVNIASLHISQTQANKFIDTYADLQRKAWTQQSGDIMSAAK
jgi:tetratricopeptide (TPR) repeat protein